MRPARPIHLLRLSRSHRQQSCLPQSDARPEIQGHIKPVEGSTCLGALESVQVTLQLIVQQERQQHAQQHGAYIQRPRLAP